MYLIGYVKERLNGATQANYIHVSAVLVWVKF